MFSHRLFSLQMLYSSAQRTSLLKKNPAQLQTLLDVFCGIQVFKKPKIVFKKAKQNKALVYTVTKD